MEQIFGKELEEDNEVDQVPGLLSQELEEINFPKHETLASQERRGIDRKGAVEKGWVRGDCATETSHLKNRRVDAPRGPCI